MERGEFPDFYNKVAAWKSISEADAQRLSESKNINTLGAIADLAPEESRQLSQLHCQLLPQLRELLHPLLPVLLVRAQTPPAGPA